MDIRTQAVVVEVNDDSYNPQQKKSVTLDAPDLQDPTRPTWTTKFVEWRLADGPSPMPGSTIMATVRAKKRKNNLVREGVIQAGNVDGSEERWQVDYRLMKFEHTGDAPTPAPASATGTISPAPTDNRWLATQFSINFNAAVKNTVEFGASQGGNIWKDTETVIQEASKIADAANKRLLEALKDSTPTPTTTPTPTPTPLPPPTPNTGGMVEHAQALGAELIGTVPPMESQAEMEAFLFQKLKLTEEQCKAALPKEFASSRDYLSRPGNTYQTLAGVIAAYAKGSPEQGNLTW